MLSEDAVEEEVNELTAGISPGRSTRMPNKNLGVDHAFDALGYMCLQVFNLAKPETMRSTDYRVW